MVRTKNTGTVFARRATRRKRILLLQLADFNPHPHVEGDRCSDFCIDDLMKFQSTPSRRGWRRRLVWEHAYGAISIHILTRRMTWYVLQKTSITRAFQSTSSHGGWPTRTARASAERVISIHILTRRMTYARLDDWQRRAVFQSTSSHGGWRTAVNSPFWAISISIHILTRRMTGRGWKIPPRRCISIHILTRRMTWYALSHPPCQRNFNPHPHTEDDRKAHDSHALSWHFNPHPHTEDDRCIWYILFRNTAYIELDATLSSWFAENRCLFRQHITCLSANLSSIYPILAIRTYPCIKVYNRIH